MFTVFWWFVIILLVAAVVYAENTKGVYSAAFKEFRGSIGETAKGGVSGANY